MGGRLCCVARFFYAHLTRYNVPVEPAVSSASLARGGPVVAVAIAGNSNAGEDVDDAVRVPPGVYAGDTGPAFQVSAY